MSILSELVGIAGTLLSAAGIVMTWNSNRKLKALKTITWSDIQTATKYFWKTLNHNNFQPTIIVTPGQKGGIIAQMIDDFYEEDIPILTGFLEAKSNGQHEITDSLVISTTKWYVHLPGFLKTCENKEKVKILIVDDFVMTGDFLHKFKDSLLGLGYIEENICSCAIAVTGVALDAKKSSDYYWKIVDNKDFDFPWGKAE